MDNGERNLRWADALLGGLAGAGVAQLVVSPGSRSSPLVAAGCRHPKLRIWVRVDERSAAYFALGLARGSGRPALLLATSGTAPAHWYPAVIEASMAKIPLILLSADRPPELQDAGANQTVDQTRLFGTHVRAFHDPGTPDDDPLRLRALRLLGRKAVEQSLWPDPGPIHINLPFREPLLPRRESSPPALAASPSPALHLPRLAPHANAVRESAELLATGPGIVVCGAGDYPASFPKALSQLAEDLGSAVLADPLSGLRCARETGARVITRYDAFLRNRGLCDVLRPAWILRFGRPPVSRVLLNYLDRHPDATQILVGPSSGWPDPLHRCERLLRGDPTLICSALRRRVAQSAAPDWLAAIRNAENYCARLASLDDPADRPFEGAVIRQLIARVPQRALVFCGNSLPIRQLDTWSGASAKPVRMLGNRGSSGIDGNVSTLLGLAATGKTPVVGMIGDLALYHDMNGLLDARQLDAVLIVLNNGGGGIFGYLPQAAQPGFERYWLTPTDLDLSLVARLYGLAFCRVRRQSEFGAAFQSALTQPGLSLIEVVIDRAYSQQRHCEYWETIAGDAALAVGAPS